MFTKSHLLKTLAVGAAAFGSASAAYASDHLDAPGVVNRGQADINDLYAFQNPNNADNTILVLTVNPFAGAPRPEFFPNPGTPSPIIFGDNVDYRIRIDNDGDFVPDVTYSTTFRNGTAGDPASQTVSVTRFDSGSVSDYAMGSTETTISNGSGAQVYAGLFDDPFFFDERGFFNLVNGTGGFTGTDAFAGANTSAIILDIPTSELGGAQVAIDATTDVDGERFDRVGRPAINTALIPSGLKNDYNQGEPFNDPENFQDEFEASITALSGDPEYAAMIAAALAPDSLTYDTTLPSGFLNGRTLTDDVIDAELALLTNGAITSDMVDGNDRAFLDVFPFLASPNTGGGNVIPTPGAAAAGVALLALLAARRRRDEA